MYNIKVSTFQNEFMKLSFLPKYEPNIVRIAALYVPHHRAEILTIFGSYFGRNDDFINSFWNLLTFNKCTKLGKISEILLLIRGLAYTGCPTNILTISDSILQFLKPYISKSKTCLKILMKNISGRFEQFSFFFLFNLKILPI